jgi:hypothetical protein
MKRKFKIGEVVRIKENLIPGKEYRMVNDKYASMIWPKSAEESGKFAIVIGYSIMENLYELDIEPDRLYVDEMLEKVTEDESKKFDAKSID